VDGRSQCERIPGGSDLRIALAAEGTRGDVYPMFALAEAFRRRGHDPVVCASPDFAPDAAARGIEYREIGHGVRPFLENHAHAVAHGGLELFRSIREYMDATLVRQFRDLPDATRGADLVIGAGVQGAAASCAELHRAVYRYVAYCPAVLASPDFAPAVFPFRPLPRWVNRVLWGALRWSFNAGMRRPVNAQRANLGLPPVRDIYAQLVSRRPVIACDRGLIELSPELERETDTIPCLHPVAPTPLPPKLETFLESGPAPVYLGFGSMTDPDPPATTRMLLDAIDRVGCRALISVGWAGLGQGPLPENVMSVGTCSHAALFPRVALVAHHGGAGTTTTAARAGTPQLLIPHLLDQYYWSQRVAQLGLGPAPIRRDRLTSGSLADALRAMLDNEWLTQRARESGARLRAAAGADPTQVFLR